MPADVTGVPESRSGNAPDDLLSTAAAGPVAIRGAAIRVVGYGAGVLLSIGSAALLFRHLGVVDAGHYVTVLALVAIVGGLTDIGLTSIGVRELAVRRGADRERLVRNLIGLRIVLTVIGGLVAVAFAAVAGYGTTLIIGTALAGVGLVLANLQSTLSIALLVNLRLGWVTLLEFVRQVVMVTLIVSLVVAGAALLPFLAASIPACLVALVLTAVLVRGEIPLMPSVAFAEWRTLVRDILPFAAATAASSIYFRLAIVMLSLISTSRQVGYFGASFRVTEVLLVVPQLLVSGAFPIFARAARDDRGRLAYGVQRMFEASALLGGLIAVILLLGAESIIAVVAGPDFRPSAGVLRIQAVTVLALFALVPWTYALLSLREHRKLLAITLGALAVNAVLVGVLGSAHGARGAAVGTLTADVCLWIGAGVCLARSGIRPQLHVLPRLAVALAAAGSLLLVTGLPDAVVAVLGSAVYVAVLLLLRAVPQEIFVELRRVRARLGT